MKKIAHSDTVLVEISRKLRLARVKYWVFRGAKIAGKKRKISRNFKSEGFLEWRKKYKIAVSISFKHSGLTALVNKRPSYVNFSRKYWEWDGIVLEKGL